MTTPPWREAPDMPLLIVLMLLTLVLMAAAAILIVKSIKHALRLKLKPLSMAPTKACRLVPEPPKEELK